jgi:hypothetical protein
VTVTVGKESFGGALWRVIVSINTRGLSRSFSELEKKTTSSCKSSITTTVDLIVYSQHGLKIARVLPGDDQFGYRRTDIR